MTSSHRRMPIGIVTSLTVVMLIAWNDAPAYELLTHSQISEAAFDLALEQRLNLGQYFEDVGLEATDIFDPDNRAAESAGFADYPNDGTPKGWLAAGSIREDDLIKRFVGPALGCPKVTNPESSLDRLLNHFFRIQTDGGGLPSSLVPFGAVSYPAPDWALGRQGHGTGPNQNRFSLLDARIYQLRSLTSETKADRQRNTAVLFRSLGHVVHILQDMAQPQHVRNDVHPPCTRLQWIGSGKSWYEQYIEDRALNVTLRFRDVVPIPVTGYDPVTQPTYREFWVSAGRSGLADVASRNFLTAGTNFGSCKGLSEPKCDPNDQDEYGTEVLRDYTVTTASGTLVGDITFITRNFIDPISGATSPSVRVSTRSVWDEHLQRIEQKRYSLNTFNYDAMADVLIPRAVGYSAGLLDFFFRGRLDVDLINDATDPSLVRLSGVNLSPDPLANGILLLFTDDTAGQRTPVTAVDSAVISAAPGGAIVSGRFQPSSAAERFFAVYAGSLGAEVPTQDSPGAVIGKAVGGTRVEHLFTDGSRWNVRTPDGVFPLPILASDIQELVWGDVDNMLVGRTAFGAGAASEFTVFVIARAVGDSAIPLDEVGQVRLQNPNPPRVAFPFGLSLGTQVVLNHTIQFRQYLPAVFRDATLGGSPIIVAQTWDFDSPVAVNATQTVSLTYQPALDLNKFNNSTAEPHFWRLRQIGASADGHILAVVTSTLQLRNQTAFFATKKYTDLCGQWPCPTEDGPARGIPVRFPTPGGILGATIVAVVDVTSGAVLYSTAPSSMMLTHTTAHTQFGFGSGASSGSVEIREVRRQHGFTNNDPFFVNIAPYNAVTCATNGPFVELGSVASETGTPQVSVGLYRPELAEIVGAATTAAFSNTRKMCFPNPPGPTPDPALPLPTFQIATDNYVPDVPRVIAGLRAEGPDRLALLFQHGVFPIVAWDRGVGRAHLRGTHPQAGGFIPTLLSTSRGKATISGDLGLLVVSLEGESSSLLFPMDLSVAQRFRALAPAFLFRIDDGKFYRTVPILEQTAFPRTLAPGATTAGSYHTLKLR
jgi:hypothetical protein